MKIVTYNVNGLRQRISQFGSLHKLLDSFDADIICFQETKVRRQELSADLVIADGYESFFSCTRTLEKGRTSYSGVATFCRVKSAFSSNEVALPMAAEEGFTGLLCNNGKVEPSAVVVSGLEEFEKEELRQIDSEGRCIITDHGHFILFNLYGPCAQANDTERIQFKFKFYKILQRRWEHLLQLGRRILVVGDLNIAPTILDRCDAGPDFEKNEFRTWLRSMFVDAGGHFSDVFRTIHPDRRDAYTCWSSSTGAEQFNFGSRIDHILSAGSCIHQENYSKDHNFMACHIKDCDILAQYKRWKPGNTPRWKGEWSTKLEGSDHAPVYASLNEIPEVAQHNTPPLSSRYLPMIRGFQQTLASVLMKRNMTKQVELSEETSFLYDSTTMKSCSTSMNSSTNQEDGKAVCRIETTVSGASASGGVMTKKAKKGQLSQLSLESFFRKSISNRPSSPVTAHQLEVVELDNNCCFKVSRGGDDGVSSKHEQDPGGSSSQEVVDEEVVLEKEDKNAAAVLEWRRIQQAMQNKIPSCKGHKEPCVSRVVKKAGPNFGRRFYTCARAEGPASNPEANCGFFKWAGGGGSKTKGK